MAGARVGINGFGRIGRLALRAAWGWPELDFVHVNELNGDAATSAHLLTFDSVHGRWPHDVHGGDAALAIEGERVSYGSFAKPGEVPWSEHGVDVVIECSGPVPHARGARRVLPRGCAQGHRRRTREARSAQRGRGRQRSPLRPRRARPAPPASSRP